MTVSLKRLLATGEFGDLRAGMTIDQVRSLIGEPDACGGASRNYRLPSVYRYETVELWFQQKQPRGLMTLYWEAGESGAFRLAQTCLTEDWDWIPGMSFGEVEDYLNEQSFRFDYVDCWTPPRPPDLLLPSGVRVTFSEEGQLYAVSAPLRT